MSASGSGGGSGGGANPPPKASLGGVLRHMLDVDDDDMGCSISLVVPGEANAQDTATPTEAAAAERAAVVAEGEPAPADVAAAALASLSITCHASSVVLKQHSEVFRRWIKGWTGGQKGTLRIECESQHEAQAFQQLLAFVHSAGRALPDEPEAMLHLLAAARKHGVESCVDACLQLLLPQVDRLPLPTCLRLVLLLETGASGNEELQAQADQLLKRSTERLITLLKQEAAKVAKDAALQAELASFLGRWHGMLNCRMRRQLWLALPFELLSVMFDNRNVHADTEATVLAAFALWAEANITATPLAPEQKERIAAVCSRIRFPAVPPDVLLNYWACFKWLQAYDPNKDLLLRALATAVDANQRALWQSSLFHPPNLFDAADAAAARELEAACRFWWTPRMPALLSDTNAATFQLQIGKQPNSIFQAVPSQVFWRGYWWRCCLNKSFGSIGAELMAMCSLGQSALMAFGNAAPQRLLYRVKATFSLALHLNGAEPCWAATSAFAPAGGPGLFCYSLNDGAGQPITWERFWAADSPFQRNGRACLELKLSVTPS